MIMANNFKIYLGFALEVEMAGEAEGVDVGAADIVVATNE
jgi:hypothetical protein